MLDGPYDRKVKLAENDGMGAFSQPCDRSKGDENTRKI